MSTQHLSIQPPRSAQTQPVEIVERKGLGHPDTLCDALAEELSRALCRFYLDRFGLVLHHNVDKVLLCAGRSRPRYGGGEVLAPLEIFFAGRATLEYQGVRVPLGELVETSARNWLRDHLHALDAERHVKLHSQIRPGSADLVALYQRQEKTGVALANDTSCGVGYAPLSPLERAVLTVEKTLNGKDIKARHPAFGEDIKVMGVRRGTALELTVACAFVDGFVRDLADYRAQKAELAALAGGVVAAVTPQPVSIVVNAADDEDNESLYLTVTGTSAESGDDGEVGRGNRVNGLITPYRPMNMEAAAGKNPVTHVGKLYNLAAQRIAEELVDGMDAICAAECYLVSRIGSPIHEPQVIDLRLSLASGADLEPLRTEIEERVHTVLGQLPSLREQLIAGRLSVF